MSLSRPSILLAAAAVAVVALAPAAQARHHGHRHHTRALAVRLVPAHQRPGWVGLAGAPLPGLVDVGLGPVFPFEGWPK